MAKGQMRSNKEKKKQKQEKDKDKKRGGTSSYAQAYHAPASGTTPLVVKKD